MKKKMGALVLCMVILGMAYWGYQRQPAHAFNPQNLIRFHVIANSDMATDQQIKYQVRDAILAEFEQEWQQDKGLNEARGIIMGELNKIQVVAANYLKDAGYPDEVRVEYGRYAFPAKGYGPITLPAGEYEALRVILGAGQGANWWCVLFPPLCFVDVSKNTVDEASAQAILNKARQDGPVTTSKPQLKFKTRELWQARKGNLPAT